MIDLSKGKPSLYKIRLEDGSLLHIKRPSQRLLMKMVELQGLSENENYLELFKTFIEVLTDVFNLNTDNKSFTNDEIGDMLDFETATMIIQDYLEFCFGELGK